MGLCKAALESATRYIAADVGPQGIRANTLSCGPIKTLAASGIKGFSSMLAQCKAVSPSRSLVSIDEVATPQPSFFRQFPWNHCGNHLYRRRLNALACCVDQAASEKRLIISVLVLNGRPSWPLILYFGTPRSFL